MWPTCVYKCINFNCKYLFNANYYYLTHRLLLDFIRALNVPVTTPLNMNTHVYICMYGFETSVFVLVALATCSPSSCKCCMF